MAEAWAPSLLTYEVFSNAYLGANAIYEYQGLNICILQTRRELKKKRTDVQTWSPRLEVKGSIPSQLIAAKMA